MEVNAKRKFDREENFNGSQKGQFFSLRLNSMPPIEFHMVVLVMNDTYILFVLCKDSYMKSVST